MRYAQRASFRAIALLALLAPSHAALRASVTASEDWEGTAGSSGWPLIMDHVSGPDQVLRIQRLIGGASTNLATLTGNVWNYQTWYKIKFDVRTQAADPTKTDLRGKIWPAGTHEPDDWTLACTDDNAALRGYVGQIGLYGRTGSGTARKWLYDDYVATPRPAALMLLMLGGVLVLTRRPVRITV